MPAQTALAAGDKVRLRHSVDRYPHFIAEAGSTGRVVEVDELVRVRMDAYLPGAETWENEIHWYLPNGDDPDLDVEVCG